MWDNKTFTHGSPASLTSKLVQRTVPEGEEASHAWLNSLPIAAAIYRVDISGAKRIATNGQFDYLALGRARDAGFDPCYFNDLILDMVDNDRQEHFERWRSPDKIQPLDVEINVSRFGNEVPHVLVSLVDRTAEVQGNVNLRREMMNDSLTGFANRIGFEERIADAVDEMQRAGGDKKFALIMFDLARFSRINESVGVLAGDELIITVAKRLTSRLRSSEIIGRLGGNEFALFAPVDDLRGAEAIASRVVKAFDDPCKLSNLEIQIDCAVAAAMGDSTTDDPMDVLRHSQIALKRAKQSKKFELFSADKLDRALHRFSLETDLRRALERDQLELHYQPLIDLESGQLNGFEALARWNHPTLGMVSPLDFIPVAEESGLIVPLGRWALEKAAKTIAQWEGDMGDDLPIKVSVNLSAVQLLRDDVPKAVEHAIRSAGIDGNRLTLELTESAFVDDPDGARRVLEALKALNTNLAMDDFGTGYSNLAYLQKLPIDVLKIDRSFVSDMLANRDNRAIVSTILSLASALGMKTTAEGIECAAVSAELKGLGCTNGQGYYFARPLTSEAAYSFLSSRNATSTS
ncbi:bifunctional diguanylate cyclase/phosphodiesterase [Sphingorhabdus sp.]|uniref:putative bifunctional diguanylate cyclase/phosphodiesterase n=1 Tax=Sphingorhabdus sp. TaxID=1902408 RepID=UPI0032B824D3